MHSQWFACVVFFLGLNSPVLSNSSASSGDTTGALTNNASSRSGNIVLNETNKPGCRVDASFDPGCAQIPYPKQAGLAIDAHCPIAGCASNDDDKAQDILKNNLCRATPAVPMNFSTFDSLQSDVDALVQRGQLSYRNGHPPKAADRARLKSKTGNLAEGDVVSLEAFVLDAKHDDAYPVFPTGEGVNCKNNNPNWNDIHIALGETATADECESVTAEIIPHFRPATWNRFDCDAKTHDAIPGTTGIVEVKGLHVRVTGQLFFDGSHIPRPCQAPKRRTSWEIHPVYKLEVEDSPGNWITFDTWVGKKGF